MAARDPALRVAATRVAAAKTNRSPELPRLKRDLAALRIENYVRKIVDAAPPLTDEQRDRIAGLLRPTAGSAP